MPYMKEYYSFLTSFRLITFFLSFSQSPNPDKFYWRSFPNLSDFIITYLDPVIISNFHTGYLALKFIFILQESFASLPYSKPSEK